MKTDRTARPTPHTAADRQRNGVQRRTQTEDTTAFLSALGANVLVFGALLAVSVGAAWVMGWRP